MSDLNDISVAIGRLQATQEQHGAAHTQIMAKLDKIANNQATITAEMPALKTDVAEALENGRDWKKNKYKGLGFVGGLSAIAGGLLGSIKDLIG